MLCEQQLLRHFRYRSCKEKDKIQWKEQEKPLEKGRRDIVGAIKEKTMFTTVRLLGSVN